MDHVISWVLMVTVAVRFVNVAALGEEFALLLHLLHPLEHAERVRVAGDCDSLVELVANHGADALHVLQLLLHLLLALLAAHGHSQLDDGERTTTVVALQLLLVCIVVAATTGVIQALVIVHGIFFARKHLQN